MKISSLRMRKGLASYSRKPAMVRVPRSVGAGVNPWWLVGVVVVMVGTVVFKPPEGYQIHNRTMIRDTNGWRLTCAVIAPTWEAYDEYADVVRKGGGPRCLAILWPEDEPLPEEMRNFHPKEPQ